MGFVAPIVEGYGEIEAVPKLLQRIGLEKKGSFPTVNPPYRINASSFMRFDHEFVKAVTLSAARAKARSGIVLILLDCEDDCAAEVGPKILAKAKATRDDVPYLVCLAIREYETWLIHGAHSLAGLQGLPENLIPPDDPERMRDAKGWFRERMGRKYLEREHQEAFSAKVDLDQMMASPSFRRMAERILPYL